MTGPLNENVSRETSQDLIKYVQLLRKWNPAINLVAPATLGEAEQRHIRDSAQLIEFAPAQGDWVDLGSGAGFPGLVCAIQAKRDLPGLSFTLVESDLRKCEFLRTVSRETNTRVTVLPHRAEDLETSSADIISARALADLSHLFDLSCRVLKPHGRMLFLKGSSWKKEVDAARKDWRFECEAHPSSTNENSVILDVRALQRA
ncbi:16S rRNA (guanine(527)-N(7))-methyltransferase RsmG [Brevirhabdus sp.]|uniref:16S rRNA (guanine(527)-N(7))-methyltransferase RsmG n=1 Tax=Brevirhabdus sp. TaxID=2004514 RepID=UPI004058C1B0